MKCTIKIWICTNNKEIEKGPFHLKQPNHKNNNLPDE